jgi:hypothetical protein
MGLATARWSFASAAPGAGDVARKLGERTGLEVRVKGDQSLEVPLIRESLFDLAWQGNTLLVHGFIPAHPYLWLQLHETLGEMGGRLVAETGWQPSPRYARLNRPWRELRRRERLFLRLPPIGVWRIGYGGRCG